LRPHAEQSRLWYSPARFKIIPAARRCGKTELFKRYIVMALWDCFVHPRGWDDPRFFAAAPTRDQAKKIFWNDFKRLVPSHWRKRPSESDLTITTNWGAELSVVGLDRPERIEGPPWDGGGIDELANCKPGIWDANIRPALADRRGWCWLKGVPDMDSPGQVDYKRMVEMARSGVDPEWDAFWWPSKDILPAEEIESAKRRMDPRLYAQEMEGQFILASGLAFPTFDLRTHVNDIEAVYEPTLPLCLSFDFNVNPMCMGIIQHKQGKIRPRVIKEFCLPDSDTNVACDAFIEYWQSLRPTPKGLDIFGDATGSARDSTSGISDWYIIEKRLKNLSPVFHIPSQNPERKDTVNAVRARLKNAAGEVGLVFHSDCRQVIDNMQTALWPSDLEPQHALAWLRYFITECYPIGMMTNPVTSSYSAVGGI
jgi:hypothetical protein